jgi:hypothetical protein
MNLLQSCRHLHHFHVERPTNFLDPAINQHIIYHLLAPLSSSFSLLGILRPASACPSGFNYTEQHLLIVPRRISRSPTGVSSDSPLSPVMPCYANRITGLSGPTSRNTERRNGTTTTNVWTTEPNLCIFSQISEGSFCMTALVLTACGVFVDSFPVMDLFLFHPLLFCIFDCCFVDHVDPPSNLRLSDTSPTTMSPLPRDTTALISIKNPSPRITPSLYVCI